MARGLGTACRLVTQRLEQDRRHMERLRDMLEQQLLVRVGAGGVVRAGGAGEEADVLCCEVVMGSRVLHSLEEIGNILCR